MAIQCTGNRANRLRGSYDTSHQTGNWLVQFDGLEQALSRQVYDIVLWHQGARIGLLSFVRVKPRKLRIGRFALGNRRTRHLYFHIRARYIGYSSNGPDGALAPPVTREKLCRCDTSN